MSIYRPTKIEPRNGHTLVVLIIARISGCATQKETSLTDQEEHGKEVVAEVYDGENVEYRIIATKGKGESLDRPELRDVEREIRSGELDLIVVEDLGRLVRGTEAVRLCGLAVDHGTCVIAPNDCINTADESWEEDVIAACRDHVGHNSHTSKRLKKKSMLRFKRLGAATPCPIAGYVKPTGAKTFHDWLLDERSVPIIREGARRLRQSLNCSLVADYFNDIGFPVGPYCRNAVWDGAMVRRFFNNTILKGKPERGNKHTVKHHESGRRKSVRNPEGPVAIDMPHLAVLSEVNFDELNALLDENNANKGRPFHHNGCDPLLGIQRKRTRFPGQHARCWYCGRHYVWGGNGITGHLQCSGSRGWKCWNSVALKGLLFNQKVIESVACMLEDLNEFEEQFREIVDSVVAGPNESDQFELESIHREETRLNLEKRNLLDAIAEFGPKSMFQERLTEIEAKQRQVSLRRARLERTLNADVDIPNSWFELRNLIESEFLSLSIESYDFGLMMQKIVPEVSIHLMRMCDGGPLLPRAKFKVDLSGAFSVDCVAGDLSAILVREFEVDVFSLPMRARIRSQAVELKERSYSLKRILATIGEKTSIRVISDALALDQQMKANGLESPLLIQYEPPTDLKKLKRHLNPRYSFTPIEGYDRPTL